MRQCQVCSRQIDDKDLRAVYCGVKCQTAMGRTCALNCGHCTTCGRLYAGRSKKYCSMDCGKNAKRLTSCHWCNQWQWKCVSSIRNGVTYCNQECVNANRQTKREFSNCQQCDCVYMRIPNERPKGGDDKRFCSRKCYGEYRRCQIRQPDVERWRHRLTKAITRMQRKYRRRISPCAICTEPVLGTGIVDRKYCSQCIASGYTNREQKGMCSLICVDCQCSRSAEHLKYNAGKRCKQCQRKVEKHRDSKMKAVRRVRMRGNAVVDTDISVNEIVKRQGLTCHICCEPCTWLDSPQGPMYPSVDHVVPLSKGGEHSWQNVRVAHRLCNSIKSDRTGLDR